MDRAPIKLGARFFCALRKKPRITRITRIKKRLTLIRVIRVIRGLSLRQRRVNARAIKADDDFAVHHDRRGSGGVQLHEFVEGLAVVGDVFGRETHALLR